MRLSYLFLPTFILFSVIFSSCSTKANKEVDRKFYLSYGDSLTVLAFDTLKKQLSNAMMEKGPSHAIDFCKTYAPDISKAKIPHDVKLKRTSQKIRNPENKADSLEMVVLEKYAQLKANNQELSHTLITNNGDVHYFKPIFIQGACTTCHGDAAVELSPKVKETLNQKYPNDQATGYQEGDLRGVWHLKFEH